MKIRTFLTCEDIDFTENSKDIIIKNMMSGIFVKQLPAKESIVILLTLDETSSNQGTLKVAMLNSKGKFLSEWSRTINENEDAFAFQLHTEFLEEGTHYIKITCDSDFLGKYPFEILKIKEVEDHGQKS